MSHSRSTWFTPWSPLEITLAVIVLFLCVITGLLTVVMIFIQSGGETLAESVAVTAPTITATFTPTPAPTVAPTVTLTPTRPLPPAQPAEPTPLSTRVVDPGQINTPKIDEVILFVEQWRGLALPDDVPINFLTRQELHNKWREESFDQSVIDTLRRQQEFYIAIGLVEPTVDLVQMAFETQTGAVLGYYSPTEKAMYIVTDSVNMFAREEMTFAHEYAHALQDHHFGLGDWRTANRTQDEALARRALPEGDAQLVEALFTRENIDQGELDYNLYRQMLQAAPEVDGVSPALGALAYFPYSAGEYFVRYLYVQGNQSWHLVNQAYRNPPVSSEQVMHPEKYLAGEQPVPVLLPDLAPTLGTAWQELDRDVLGEIGLLVWLLDGVEPTLAINSAAGWDGDAYTLWVDNEGRRLLALQTVWESVAEADEFFEAFVLYTGLPELALRDNSSAYTWSSDLGLTLLERQGKQVLLIIAPDETVLANVRGQFSGF